MKAIFQRAADRQRHHAHHFWLSRGGGFYGFVAALTFVYLEAVDLVGDIAGLAGVRINVGYLVSWLVSNAVAALLNVLRATLWPIAWMGHFGLGIRSGLFLLGAYLLYLTIRPLALRLLGEKPGIRHVA